MKGKTVTIILLLAIFLIGLAIIIFDPDRFNPFVTLVQLMLAPMLVIMGGIAGQSIAKVIKGEAKIEDVQKEMTSGFMRTPDATWTNTKITTTTTTPKLDQNVADNNG